MKSIAICICTYKRYDGLNNLLRELIEIQKPDDFKINIIVVDNDPAGSASGIQQEFNGVEYFIENDVGVSSARNRAVEEARKLNADIIAFLDDDEIPTQNWLVEMLSTLEEYRADVVAGPVIATLPAELKGFSRFMLRKRHATGTPIEYWGAGNVLLRAEVFDKVGLFSPDYSRLGGEDTQFSARCAKQNLRMVWSDAATVFEPTDATRANPKWLIERAYNKGRIIVKVERELGGSSLSRRIAVALVYLLVGLLGWPLSWMIDQILATRYNLASSIAVNKGFGMIKELANREKLKTSNVFKNI